MRKEVGGWSGDTEGTKRGHGGGSGSRGDARLVAVVGVLEPVNLKRRSHFGVNGGSCLPVPGGTSGSPEAEFWALQPDGRIQGGR